MRKQKIVLSNGYHIGTIFYDEPKQGLEKYISGYIKNMEFVVNFFDLVPSKKIQIHLLYKRKQMDEHWGMKSPDWLSGMVDNENPYVNYIFSPLVTEELTIHKKGSFLETIVHESAHVFVTELNKRCFSWMNEGVCQYVEPCDKKYREVKQDNWDWFIKNDIFTDPNSDWPGIADHNGYQISFNLCKHIIDGYGKNTYFDLIRIERRGPKKDLQNKMENVLQKSLKEFSVEVENIFL